MQNYSTKDHQKQSALLWIVCCLLVLIFGRTELNHIFKLLTPILVTTICLFLLKYIPLHYKLISAYFLFFSISIVSVLGLSAPLTGGYAATSNPYLYGLSFYAASMAFHLYSRTDFNLTQTYKFSNPLLLITGPIVLFIKKRNGNRVKNRINYYLPFIILGLFFYQLIASPLISLFFLIEKTDIISTLLFAIIFEIFVYANFCGLSLMIFGVFGVVGYKIPLNFQQPFTSSNVIEFWQGWHVSLSTVLKTIFYLPSRQKFSQFFSLCFVFLASALWHGVTLNFLIWGCFHAFIFWISVTILKYKVMFLPTILLFVGVILGRLIFAESDIFRLLEKLTFSYNGTSSFAIFLDTSINTKLALILGLSLISIEFAFQKNSFVKKRNYKHLRTPLVQLFIIIIIILFIINTGGDYAVYGQR